MQINPMLLKKIGAMMPNEQKNVGMMQNENSLAGTSIFAQAEKDKFQDLDEQQLEQLMGSMGGMMQNPMMQGLDQFTKNEELDPMEKLMGNMKTQGQEKQNPFMTQGLQQVKDTEEMNPMEKLLKGGLKAEGNEADGQKAGAGTDQQSMMEELAKLLKKFGIQQG